MGPGAGDAQEAFAVAAERWPREGAPASPRAWLVTTARNRAIDRIRRDQIAALYGELARLTGSAVVELNRAIAVAKCDGPEAGLALVDRLDLDGYQYLHSTRADLLRRLDRRAEARAAYERALELARAEPERRFLERRLAELAGPR